MSESVVDLLHAVIFDAVVFGAVAPRFHLVVRTTMGVTGTAQE